MANASRGAQRASVYGWLPWLLLILVAVAAYTWRPLPDSQTTADAASPSLADDQAARLKLRLETEELTAVAMGNFADQLERLNQRLAPVKQQDPASWTNVAEAAAMAELMASDLRTSPAGDFGRLFSENLLPEQRGALPQDVVQAAALNQVTLGRISGNIRAASLELEAGAATDSTWANLGTARTQVAQLTAIQRALAAWRREPDAVRQAVQDAQRLYDATAPKP